MACRVNFVAVSWSHCAPERCDQKTIETVAEALTSVFADFQGECKQCRMLVKEEAKGERTMK
jgi:hypothetical protein